MQEDMAPMEYIDPESGYVFVWKGRSMIDVGMPWTNRLHGDVPADTDMPYQFFGNISVRDQETGEFTIPPEYDAFKARCLEWLEDQWEVDSDGTETEIY